MNESNYKPVGVGDWMLTYLLMCIPIVNLILLFVWAFGNNTPPSKANWAKASLIWLVLGIILYLVIFIGFAMFFAALSASA